MGFRVAVGWVAALAAILALAGCNRIRTSQQDDLRPVPSGPSVLLVTIDTLRADHVGAYGASGAETPTLDGLAQEGVLFEAAFATGPLTLPSHSSILTGMTPPRHGVRHNGLFRLSESTETLAERFHDAGYDTGAVLGAVVLHARHGLDQGFDFYDVAINARRASQTGYPERSAAEVTDVALRWLAERERPFFLWLHYYDPHAAYQPPAPFSQRFAGRLYDGEIAYVDAQIARVFGALRSSGAWRDTLVAVTSDHGESLGEHGELTHAYTLYDAVLKVPLLLRGPNVPASQRVGDVVSTIDLAPTLLALAGLPPLHDADGRDLSLSWSTPGDERRRVAYAESLATELDHGWAPLFAMRSEDHLYVRAPRPELYDVGRDPAQLENLLNDPSEASVSVAKELERELESALDAERSSIRIHFDADTLEQLHALGYAIQNGSVARSGMDPKDGLRLVKPFVIADSEYHTGRFEEAEAHAKQLLSELPASPQVHDLLARIYIDKGRLDLAIEHAERSVALLPGAGKYHDRLGMARLAAGDVAGALRAYARAVECDPTLADSHAGLMWRAASGGSVEEAEQSAARALKIAPESARIRNRIADTWDRLGHYQRALETYREALALDPSSEDAHMGLAIALARLGDVSEADAHFAHAGKAAERVDSRMRLAIAWAGRGEAERAERVLRGLMASYPDFEAPRKVLAVLMERTGRAEEGAQLEAER